MTRAKKAIYKGKLASIIAPIKFGSHIGTTVLSKDFIRDHSGNELRVFTYLSCLIAEGKKMKREDVIKELSMFRKPDEEEVRSIIFRKNNEFSAALEDDASDIAIADAIANDAEAEKKEDVVIDAPVAVPDTVSKEASATDDKKNGDQKAESVPENGSAVAIIEGKKANKPNPLFDFTEAASKIAKFPFSKDRKSIMTGMGTMRSFMSANPEINDEKLWPELIKKFEWFYDGSIYRSVVQFQGWLKDYFPNRKLHDAVMKLAIVILRETGKNVSVESGRSTYVSLRRTIERVLTACQMDVDLAEKTIKKILQDLKKNGMNNPEMMIGKVLHRYIDSPTVADIQSIDEDIKSLPGELDSIIAEKKITDQSLIKELKKAYSTLGKQAVIDMLS